MLNAQSNNSYPAEKNLLFTLMAVLLLFLHSTASCQEKPTIAVIPLASVEGITGPEANALTTLLETVLVQSGRFKVIEKSEIAEVLKAQEYTLEGFTEESFAIKVGKLLTAKMIVLGSILRIGSQYFLSAKIVDVGSGETRKAEVVKADSLGSLADQIKLLGNRLAGLNLVHDLELATALRRNQSLTRAGWICYGISTVFTLGMGTTLLLHQENIRQAAGVSSVQQAEQLGRNRTVLAGLSLGFGIIGSLSALIGTIIWLERVNIGEMR